MGLPTEDKTLPGAVDGTPHDGEQPRELVHANGDAATEPDTRDKPRAVGRRPSGHRTCGKCQQHLAGQFVRALGDTYHLECFTCHVRALRSYRRYYS